MNLIRVRKPGIITWRDFFAANVIGDDNKKKAILLSASGPETYTLFRNLCSPNSPAEKSYAELKTLIKNHLHPTPNPIAERFKFNSRDRHPTRIYPASWLHCVTSPNIVNLETPSMSCYAIA